MFRVPAIIHKVATMVDGGLSLTVHTQEMEGESEVELFKLRKKTGWFLFAENPDDLQVDDLEPVEVDEKTPSQRLRSVLYVYWKAKGSKKTFNSFYNDYMEKLIETLKERVSQEEHQ